MKSVARTHTDPATLARLRDLIEQLSNGARFRFTLQDGTSYVGRPRETPRIEIGVDEQGKEGEYAIVSILGEGDHVLAIIHLDKVHSIEPVT